MKLAIAIAGLLAVNHTATAQDFAELLELRRVKETLALSQVPEP